MEAFPGSAVLCPSSETTEKTKPSNALVSKWDSKMLSRGNSQQVTVRAGNIASTVGRGTCEQEQLRTTEADKLLCTRHLFKLEKPKPGKI